MTASADVAALWSEHHAALWGLCYRLTGSAADADDLVQETFRKVIESPPSDLSRPWRPWLMRVAVNLALDLLRQRQARKYVGPWLPSPIETQGSDDVRLARSAPADAEARYGALESVAFAFLLALERLEPRQRAVLVLRDVLGFSGPEVAECLDLTAGNVRVILHRARELMAEYDAHRRVPTPELQERTRQALREFMQTLATGDLAAVSAMLAAEVRTLQDGGGELKAALRPVHGRDQVARLLLGLRRLTPPPIFMAEREINGTPALLTVLGERPEGYARKGVLRVDVTGEGRILEIHSVLAPPKLTHVRFE
jgi:RNA polymerase sigma factor (sigma-70 family)